MAQLRALDGERVLLIGVSPGKTALLADGARRDLIITPVDEAALVRELHALLDGAPVLAGWDGACVWLECPTCSAAQRERVAQVRGLYPCVRAVDVISPGRPALDSGWRAPASRMLSLARSARVRRPRPDPRRRGHARPDPQAWPARADAALPRDRAMR